MPDLATIPDSAIILITSKLRRYFARVRIWEVSLSTVSRLCEITSGFASITLLISSLTPSKSGINVSMVVSGLTFLMVLMVSAQKAAPPSSGHWLATDPHHAEWRRRG